MRDPRIVFADDPDCHLGGDVAGYSFMPHTHPDRPIYGKGWSVRQSIINVAKQGFPLRVIMTDGEVIEVRRRDA